MEEREDKDTKGWRRELRMKEEERGTVVKRLMFREEREQWQEENIGWEEGRRSEE